MCVSIWDEAASPSQLSSHSVERARAVDVCHSAWFHRALGGSKLDGLGRCLVRDPEQTEHGCVINLGPGS
jgi:hypothetical protein